jgi:hypothetical protein
MNLPILTITERDRIDAGKEATKALLGCLTAPGTYDFKLDIEVTGTVTIGKSHEQAFVQQACPWTCLALVLEEFGATKMERLERAIRTVAAMTPDERKDEREDLKEMAENVMDLLGYSTVKMVVGRKTFRDLMVTGGIS